MIMNTAYGKPDVLPFDLKMRRITTYEITQESEEKVTERKNLAGVLDNALRTTISQIDATNSTGIPSGNKISLAEECQEILRRGDVQEWRRAVSRLSIDIPKQLRAWVEDAQKMWKKATPEERDAARYDAIEICLPSFVPIFVAVESGKMDFWREAIGPMRQLALFRDQLGGGFTNVIEIGSHTLYFVGSIGMAIAARAKQLDVISGWMTLPMPTTHHRFVDQISWLEMREIHHLWGKYMPKNRAPFEEVLKVCESDHLFEFVGDRQTFQRYLFVGNLAQSLFELGRWVEDPERLRALESDRNHRLAPDLNVWPVWALMEPNEFRAGTWELFGDSEGLRQFVFPGNGVSLEKLWACWKRWKDLCEYPLMQGEIQTGSPRMVHAEWLMLPGEPQTR
jgi:hypothetical protein